ncbi:hypothetical protein ANCCAN_03215 [Ancylostoma caninum]|uniref:SCP domain-containing protein n=1 Tax=Ancylostoma caninum TaxID=29170 RepID=A0A368H1W4_ANCCA|nr:hypothetical protein ANCCAN_03215 [Ancylostoma caninum]
MVSTTRTVCSPSVGTFPDQDTVLNKLAKLIEGKVKGATYSCALEPSAYLKFVKLTEEQWNKVYGKVKYTKELKYETEEENLEDPASLANKAVEKWSSELKGVQATHFGCVVDAKPDSPKTTYKVACLFK